jgi:hypothetical protein
MLIHTQAALVYDPEEDILLVTSGKRPLIFIRQSKDYFQLVFNFAPEYSNVMRTTAFIVLLQRFCNSIRDAKARLERKNLECGQDVSFIAKEKEEISIKLKKSETKITRPEFTTPFKASFLTILSNKKPLLETACQFTDVNEATLKNNTTINNITNTKQGLISVNHEQDFLRPVWLLLIFILMLINWLRPDKGSLT